MKKYNRIFTIVIDSLGIGGIETIQNQIRILDTKGPNRISPLTIPMAISNIAAGNMAIEFGIKGSCISLTTACATSSHAIGEAFRNIRDGYSDIVISGGTEASVTEFSIGGFQALTALSNRQK